MVGVGDWDVFTAGCPICGSEGLIFGYTDLSGEFEEDGSGSYRLDFLADSFQCDECGLILDDTEELRLVDMETYYDRSSELDQWFSEQEPDY
jgi:hypothetical protein